MLEQREMQQAHWCNSGIIHGTYFDSIHRVYISDKNNRVVQHADGGFDGIQSNKTKQHMIPNRIILRASRRAAPSMHRMHMASINLCVTLEYFAGCPYVGRDTKGESKKYGKIFLEINK